MLAYFHFVAFGGLTMADKNYEIPSASEKQSYKFLLDAALARKRMQAGQDAPAEAEQDEPELNEPELEEMEQLELDEFGEEAS